jgi:gamma-glutamylcyclotransferase (GGCT)/AIG2-like uncharacterized protein YtfP
MTDDPDYLIVYGTLRPAFDNPPAQFLRQHSRYVGDASFPGQLFDLGLYPGATYYPDCGEKVSGSIYDVADKKQMLLAYLDEYEGVGEPFDQPNEYVRTVIQVCYNNSLIGCWVYLYNYPTYGKRAIQSGNYVYYSMNE